MTDLRVIIREFAKGTPLREIERKLGLSRTSIRTYRERAEQSGRAMLELQSLEDAELTVHPPPERLRWTKSPWWITRWLSIKSDLSWS